MFENKNYKKINRGFTIIELIIYLAIFGMISVVVSTFAKDVFSLNTAFRGTLNTQLDARHLVKVMVAELRKTAPSALGSYPILLASTSALTFYTDVNSNGVQEKVRYYVDGSSIKKGVVVPSGSPLTYNDANEKISTLITGDIASSTQPLFQYYPDTYTGNSSAMTQPVIISDIRLIKITVIIDKDPGHSPVPLTVTSSVSLRNLKDNL